MRGRGISVAKKDNFAQAVKTSVDCMGCLEIGSPRSGPPPPPPLDPPLMTDVVQLTHKYSENGNVRSKKMHQHIYEKKKFFGMPPGFTHDRLGGYSFFTAHY